MRAIAIIAALGIAGGALYLLVGSDEPEGDSTEEVESKRAERSRNGGGSARRGRSGDAERSVPEAPLEVRVERLEKEVAMLRRALAIRGKVAMGGRSDDDGESPTFAAEDPVLEDAVRDIYEEEREREREEERERRSERFEEFRKAALDDLVQVAGLDNTQREGVENLWSSEAERMLPLIDAMRSGDRGFAEVRDEIRGLREETDNAAKAMLSDSQYESYLESRPRGPGGPRGRRGRGSDNNPRPPR